MFIEKLRSATKEAHVELDHLFYPVIQEIKSKDDYVAVLSMMYSFFKPVYEGIYSSANDNILRLLETRRQPEWILDDISVLTSNTPAAHEPYENIPTINNVAEAYGAFYVMEGSTMGGPILVKKIAALLHIENKDGLKFFSGYGSENKNKWQGFISAIDEYAATNTDKQQEIINAATQTFIEFKNCVSKFKNGK